MAKAHFFGEDILDFDVEVADAPNLARRQLMFSLTVGGLLLAVAAIMGAHPLMTDRAPVALHQVKVSAPPPIETIAAPNAYSSPEG